MTATLLAAILSFAKFASAGVGGAIVYAVAHKASIVKAVEDAVTLTEDALSRKIDRLVPDVKAIAADVAALKSTASK